MLPALEPGQSVSGFTVASVTPLPEVRSVGYMLRHEGSGARLLHVHADDSENLFSITLPTLPADDAGAPHIMEHAVLAGSRRFPVREPFFEMLKMSMATFINAFTDSDCTCYPVASNVHKDLFNLAEVYFDAVFHPLLSEDTFLREGHRLAPADPQQPAGELKTTGIVYNEMKGAYSAPERRLFSDITSWLLPDTIYARDSGGRPESIPDLTYADFKRFYENWYHPSNAYFFMYGDIPTREYLAFLEPRLEPFARRAVPVEIARQPRWAKPRESSDEYPVGEGESLAEKTFIVTAWLAGTATDPEEAMALQVCSRILLGNEGAPLRKALIDARLGQDLAPGSGFHGVGAEALFQVGVKGSEVDRLGKFETTLDEVLRRLADEPLPQERVEAAFQQAAYANLEVLPMFPLHMMGRVVDAWRYGVDPYAFVRLGQHLDACRRRYADDPLFFNRLLKERLVDNPHRLTLVLHPSRQWQERSDAAFAERMRRVRDAMSDPEAARIAQVSDEVEQRSGTPNPPEALALLPQLQVADVPRKPLHIPTTVQTLGPATLLRNDVFANGVNYLVLDFDLGDLPADLWPYIPFYRDAVHKMGAAGQPYEVIAQRVAAHTGGIGCGPLLSRAAGGQGVRSLRFDLKTLDGQMEDALALAGDLLFALEPGHLDRLREVTAQALAAARTRLVNDGTGTALRHAGRRLGPESHLDAVAHGLQHLRLLERLTAGFDGLADDLVTGIGRIARHVARHGRLTASFTGGDAAFAVVSEALGQWLRGRMRPGGEGGLAPVQVDRKVRREGLTSPSQIAYAAEVMPAPTYGSPDSALLEVGSHLVNGEYMLSELRLKGNAYGGGCFYDALGGRLAMYSYRDPHVARTLKVFAGTADHVRRASWTQADVDRSIIGTLKNGERPIRPGEATATALSRWVAGVTPELRERRHEQALGATPEAVRAAVLSALEAASEAAVCVVANRRMLDEANRELGADRLEVEDILRGSD